MDNSSVQLVGNPCGQHGPYTFYKAFKYVKNGFKRLVKLSEFFFVKLWSDSDLVCIGELQLLWIDKNSEQVLSSLRLYFLPENTPEGRMDHGEDEVLAISEKVVLRLDDLITWITADAEWTWGRLAKCDADVKEPKYSDNEVGITNINLNEGLLDFSDIEKEQMIADEKLNRPTVIILSYPSYCRYRSIMKRLEGVEDEYLKHTVVKVLGGFTAVNKNTRVLFCRDTFDYPELEGHELLCNHLAPKLKGRPRGRRKKRSLSPGSESNESESSVCNMFNSNKTKLMTEGNSNGLRSDNLISPRRSTRANVVNTESKEFLKKLSSYMKSIHTPIGRIPSLGFKELDLYSFFTKVNKLGGYDAVTTNRLWKSIFDDLSGNYISTSAATVIRRHYERFLLPYELYLKGEEYKMSSSSNKSSKSRSCSGSDADTSESTSCSGKSTPVPQLTVIPIPANSSNDDKDTQDAEKPDKPKHEIKTSSLRSVRVKPERLRDHVSKDRAAVVEKCSNTDNINNKMANEFSVEIKTELESSCTKNISESNLLNNGLTVELITTALPTVPKNSAEEEVHDVVTDKVSKDSVTIEPSNTDKTPVTPPPPFQNSLNDKVVTPEDGKENIATCNTNNISSAQCKPNETDLIEVPCEQKTSEIVNLETDPINSISSNSTISKSLLHSVKKRKLDILKEGGLEVTPVKPVITDKNEIKESRPSVIHHNLGIPKATVGQLSITLALDKQGTLTSPNSMEISQRLLPTSQAKDIQNLPSTSIMRTNVKSSKKHESPNTSFLYGNGQSPPKVVQSRSIYSYSEKTVYGNPKDYFMPPARPLPQTPKFIENVPKQMGGDILDLTTKSPQKPIVEIMRVPTVASRFPMGISELPSKKAYKNSPSLPVLDARVGSNLEITIVGSNGMPQYVRQTNKPMSRYNSVNRSHPNGHALMPTSTYTSKTANMQGSYNINNKLAPKRTFNGSFVSNKKEENGRLPYSIAQTQQAYAPRDHRQHNNLDYISSSYSNNRNSTPKLDNNRTQTKPHPQQSSNLKPYASTPSSAIPAYLSQLSMASKMVPPYVPSIDPLYYSALQSLYPHTPLSSVPQFFPVPTPDHLQFYTDLMARNSHIRYPFPYPQDGNSSVTTANTETNNFKKQ